jgi:GT2 family glycosyltransferase
VRQRPPDLQFVYVSDSYIGTAHAVRRDVFLRLQGYREHLVHQGEEGDYCIRMLEAGYFVRLGTADPVHHRESPKRDLRRMDYYGARNSVLFAWQNAPAPFLPAHLAVTTARCLLHSVRPSRLKTRTAGLIEGYLGIARRRAERDPVSVPVYAMQRKLKKSGPRLLGEVASQLALAAECDDVGVARSNAR